MARSGLNTSGADAENAPEKKKLTKQSFQQGLRIFRFVLPYKGMFIAGLLLLLLSSVSTMVMPKMLGYIVSVANHEAKALPAFVPKTITGIALLLFGVVLLQGIFSFFRIFFFSRVSEFTVRDIRRTLYQKLVTLPIPFFEQRRVGEITSRLTSDVANVQDTFSLTLAEFMRQILTLLAGVGFIMWESWRLSLFMLATFPPLVLLAFFFGRSIRKLSKQTQDELAKTNVIVEETLQGISSVKAFTSEQHEVSRYGTGLNRTVQAALKSSLYRGAFVSFIIVAVFGGIFLVLWRGATYVDLPEADPRHLYMSDLVSFILYTMFIGASVGGLGEMYGKIQSSLGATERLLEILDEESEPVHQPRPAGAAPLPVYGDIRYENVQFRYPTRPDLAVLKDISFHIEAGEKVALVGPSGAGKSTIVQLLMHLYPLSGGSISVDGRDINILDLTELRQHIGIVPQETMLFGGTIRENILYGRPGAPEADVVDAARRANAWQFIQSFPEGLDTVVGERGIKLSGGQRQRIAIARAILKNPAILLLDEATSALDSESEKLVQQAMDELMQNRTSIIIAHRLSTIRKVDKILVIDGGRIVEQGTHEQLSNDENGLYANLLKLQFELT
ncbi:ABC-type multidrug transport system fused ATPase/permease subunit [Hymenobacter luteus]|uniref:ABC-type multidrug transport system fused ATPase/permease subunit n=2 Tax=Hymenobacter TaxID=89966 RepID=A0A7W9T145_9BACT|nr:MULTISPECIES: ABC transporter transmembrane domain-containing protein [Hymenobacter]MBB4600768.1 ABC-type multidrug transport system fused ATPase/permease subunit [Hymenobacter latericoloratus]MBB6059025.1 ABC-type multidrug transport system fused ATPase/permease subunit [Hymenobacter luteus]